MNTIAKAIKALLLTLSLFMMFAASKSYAQGHCTPTYPAGTNCDEFDLITKVWVVGTDFYNEIPTCINGSRFFDYSSNTSEATLHRNAGFNTYTLSVTTNDDHIISMWIDYNHDSIFSGAEWVQVCTTSSANTANTVSFTVPASAKLGSTRMRIRSRYSGLLNDTGSACISMLSGAAHDYHINIDTIAGCSGTPTAGSVNATRDSFCSGENSNMYMPSATAGISITYQWQSSTDTVNWTAINGATLPAYLATNLTATKYYRCYIVCNNSNADTSKFKLVKLHAPVFCNCASGAGSTADDDIGNVSISNLNNGNASPAQNNSTATRTYSDFTHLSPAILVLGDSIPLSVTQINKSGFIACYMKVFIDKNMDGTFTPSTETVMQEATTAGAGNNTISKKIYLDTNLATGYTRMRIVLIESALAANVAPCGSYGYGETEDYTLYFSKSPCTTPPTAGQTIVSSNNECAGTTFKLSLQGNSVGKGQTYQWQLSTDSVTWSNVTGATSLVLNTNQTANKYYRCMVTCSGNSDSSAHQLVTCRVANQCYCEPKHATCTGSDIITNVNILSTCLNNNVSGCNTTSPDYYYDFTGIALPILIPGQNYSLGVTTNEVNVISVWIDYDQDGQLEASEWVQVTTNSTAYQETVKTITIPAGAKGGVTRMRIRINVKASQNGSGDACTNMSGGVAHDYNVNIRKPLAKDVAVSSMVTPENGLCFSANEAVEIALANTGKDTINMAKDSVHLSVEMTVSGNTSTMDTVITSGKIAPGGLFNVIFNNTFDMSTGSIDYTFLIKASFALAVDSQGCNDSILETRYSTTPISQPYIEDFEYPSSLPITFTSNGYKTNTGTGAGTPATISLRAAMSSGAKDVYCYTPLLGPLTNISTFKFSYRTTTQVPSGDSVCIFVSADCGKNFDQLFTIKSSNSIGNTFKVMQLNLDKYSGSNVIISIANFYKSGSTYNVDFDDFAVGERPEIDLGPDTSICGSITIDGNPNGLTLDYMWNNGNTTPKRTFGATGTYILKAIDPTSAIFAVDTVRIVVYNKPTVTIPSYISICPGGSASAIDAGTWPSNYAILWSSGDTSRLFTPTTSGTYILTVTTPGGCFGVDTVVIAYSKRPSGVEIIQGSPFNGKFNNGTPDEVCIGSTITYELTPPSGYSNADFGKKWKVVGNGPILMTSNGTMPATGTVSAKPATASTNAQMTFQPRASESDSSYTIYLTVKDSVTGCDTVILRSLQVHGLPIVTIGDQLVCPGSSATFDAGTFSNYSWSTGDTTQTISTSTGGKYSVEVTDANGCKNIDTTNLTIFKAPIANLGPDKKICPGVLYTLSAGTFNGYTWSTSESTRTISINAEGDYFVEVTDSNGCKDIDSINITFLPKPIVTFSQSIVGLNVTFTPSDLNLQSYHWYFGDGGQSYTKIATHAYPSMGNYNVSLVTTGNNGCMDSLNQPLDLNNAISNIEGLSSINVFPNPYADQTTLQLNLSKTAKVTVVLFDQLGRKIATIADRNMTAGANLITIDTRQYQAARGIYDVQITVNDQRTNLRIVDLGR
ncbi:MAG: T9SS type A sorting domain-containing protein [Flavobacteriaceae bacterium]|nr:T9SS type A sorting domain-containing protein [Flavobacteriaceae bacterium]